MTPAARLSAAIAILDRFLAGEAAEKALTNWARGARYAGSGDRAAVRDVVFQAIRRLRSQAALGGAMTGRGLVLGGLRADGVDPDTLFTGQGHAPAPLAGDERAGGRQPEGAEALDCPDWLEGELRASLGEGFEPAMRALQHRAPVHLRANLLKADRAAVAARLAGEGVETRPHPLSPTALEVTEGARRLQASATLAEGWAELQDAASQAVTDTLPLKPGMKVLDYCAGGGGKTLALAGRAGGLGLRFYAHDANPARMRDLPARAARAGAEVTILDDPAAAGPYDLVLCDVPCSGSGAWRRAPEGKWRLDRAGLDRLLATQAEILDLAAGLVRENGVLAYATCSLLRCEDQEQAEQFSLRNPGWEVRMILDIRALQEGDGFFIAHLTRAV